MKLLRSILTLVLSISSITALLGQPNKLQKTLDSLCDKSGYPGMVFSHIDSNNNVYAYASGYANLEKRELMTVNHKLHGGSTGKTIVSALIMQLVQKGEISLDDKVSQYFKKTDWYSRMANAKDITIKHLMQHTSGIVRYEMKETFLNALLAEPKKVWQPEELLAFVLDDTPPFPAGKGFTYADTNYILLGMIIEKVTKRDFYELAKERVLDPLGIDGFHPTKNPVPYMAQGYYSEKSEYALGFKSPFLINGLPQNNMQFEWTGGGYAFRNADYAYLLKQLYEGKLFGLEQLVDEYFNYVDAPEIGCKYGLGIMRYEFPGHGEFIGHSGFFPGYYTIGLYHTETKQAFSLQINSVDLKHLQSFFPDYFTLVRQILTQD